MENLYLMMSLFLLSLVLFTILPWLFAYRKPGIKYITFCLIAGPLIMFRSYFEASKSMDLLGTINMIASCALYVWWYTRTVQLRTINKKLKAAQELKNTSASESLQAQS